MNNLQQNILDKIKAGEIGMKPKWHFMLRGLLWVVATLMVALIVVYLLSFVMFALRESGLMFAPLFGWTGIVLFIVSSPWILIATSGVFLVVLYMLVSRYSFSYQKPLVYSMIGLVLLVIALSSLIQATNFHGRAGDFATRHGVPGLAPMYRDIGQRPARDITRGTVSELTDTTFMLTTENGDRYTVELTKRTKLPRASKLADGNVVYVFGPKEEERINAFGVRIDNGQPLPPPPGEKGERPNGPSPLEGGGERGAQP